MITSSRLYLNLDSFTPKHKDISLGDLTIRFSEKTSRQSDPSDPQEIWLNSFSHLKHPDGALATILALSLTRMGWSAAETTEKLLETIFNLAKNHNFEGKWDTVGRILSTRDLFSSGIHGILEVIVEEKSEEDFYGNFLPKVYLIIEKNLVLRSLTRHYKELSRRERYRGIQRKIRRRGYRDKGSLRPKSLSDSEIRSDVWLQEKEAARKAIHERYQMKDPLSYKRYWYGTYRDRLDKLDKTKGGISHGRHQI